MRTLALLRLFSKGITPWGKLPARVPFSFRKYSDFILKSAFPDVTIPMVSLTEELHCKTSKWENNTALVCGITGRSYTFSQVWDSSQRFGNALQKLGLHRREVLGIISPNNPEFAIAALGTISIGGIITTVNHTLTVEEMANQLNNSDAKYLVTIPSLLPVIRKVRNIYRGIQEVIVIGDTEENYVRFSDMLKEDGGTNGRAMDIDVHETVLLLSSSGTTGPPKGVMLTHYNIVAMRHICDKLKLYNLPTDSFQEVFTCLLPLYDAFGLIVIVLQGLLCGAKTVTLPEFDPRTYINVLERYKPTILHLVPPMIAFLSDYPEVKPKHFEHIHSLLYGGAPIGMSLINKLRKKMHPASPKFLEAYGMTECLPITINPRDNYVLGSCGVVLPNTRVKIIDTKTGNILGVNQSGEICAQGPQMMKGYLKNPEATAATIEDGWIHTGDVGYFDENGYIYIVDRVKELIKVKGLQVAPSELEDVLRSHPSVQDAGVVGIPDEVIGELPRAYVVLKDTSVTEEDIRKYVDDNVARHKKLTGGVKFIDAIPKSATGKILRRELKEKALSGL